METVVQFLLMTMNLLIGLEPTSNHGMYKRYYHDLLGVNSRLDSLQAAILKVKLKYLDSYNQKNKCFNEYNNALKTMKIL